MLSRVPATPAAIIDHLMRGLSAKRPLRFCMSSMVSFVGRGALTLVDMLQILQFRSLVVGENRGLLAVARCNQLWQNDEVQPVFTSPVPCTQTSFWGLAALRVPNKSP